MNIDGTARVCEFNGVYDEKLLAVLWHVQ
jgi:hypothetical protein